MCDRTYLTIDIEALRHNISLVRDKVGKSVKIMCVVKANAYGHGAVEVAKHCCDFVDYFGVATIDEGIELRERGICLPVLVVGDTPSCRYADALDYDISLTLHSYETATSLNDFCKLENKLAKVHLAVDSGMGRIGFLPSEIDKAVEVCRLKNIRIEGVFTHFAKADSSDKTYTDMQMSLFDNFVSELRKNCIDVGIRHVANSASILDSPQYNCDMVRMGIITYGLFPSKDVSRVNLRPVMSWRTHIVHIKTLPKGRSVSYGGDFVTKRDTIVATLAVGYGDGYPRALSDKGYAIVNGKKAPIIGRICMDQTMIDVTDIEGVKVGDIVVLMGSQGEETISADDIAKLAGTINYEIVCGIAPRVPRIFV